MRILRFPLSLVFAATLLATLASCGGGGTSAAGAGNTALVTMTTTSIPDTATGLPYSTQFEAHFPHSPGSFLVTSGALPPGLSLDKSTGEVSGYPRQTGVFHFEIAARDGADEVPLGGGLPAGRDASFAEDRRTFSVSVTLGLPHILPQTVPSAQYRASYSYQIEVAGGTAPYTFAETNGPNLPAGLSVSSKGILGLFPTKARQDPYDFEVTVTDAQGLTDTATMSVQVLVLPLIFLTADPIQEAAVGFPYDIPLALASVGAGQPYTWSQVAPVAGETNLSTIGMEVGSNGHVHDLGAGPLSVGTFKFTAGVTDEIGQLAVQHFTLKVNPGPVLNSITPNRSSSPAPYTVKGLNFQQGAKLILKPGPTQTFVVPNFVDSTTLTVVGTMPKPSDGAGGVDVMVVNPDGGSYTKSAAFVFPAATISFGTKGFVSSGLSSTGLAVADLNGDGKPDLVHCGAASMTVYSGGPTSTNAGLILHLNQGGSPPTFGSTTLDVGNFYDVKLADVNGDGRTDIVALGQSAIKVWLNGVGANPIGTFSAGPSSPLGSGIVYPSVLALGKLNSDGLIDAAVGVSHNPSYGMSNTYGRVDVMMGTGGGNFVLQDSANGTMPWATGVVSMTCIDTDGNGRDELAVGIGMNSYTSYPPLTYVPTTTTGFFGTWATKGTAVAPPYYGGTTCVTAGDFLGNGTPAVLTLHSSTYSSPARVLSLYSGSTLANQTNLPAPTTVMKQVCTVDADFDARIDFAISTVTSTILVYKGTTQVLAATLDASVGNPSVASPRTGFLASADLDGDGRPDMIATTSFWQVEEMAANYGSPYALLTSGNGGSMGIVFFLNNSN